MRRGPAQRLCDILPKPIEQQTVGGGRQRRVSDMRVSEAKSKQSDDDESDGRADMDLGTMGNGETTKTTTEDKKGTRQETRWD